MVEPFQAAPEEWDAFVRSQSGWTHFHLYGWRAVVERVFGHEVIYTAARGPDGRLTAVLPLVRVRSALFGHFLVSMPFVSYGGPLGDAAGIQALTAQAAERARAERVTLLQLRSGVKLPLDLPVSHRKIGVILDLPAGGSDALWKQIPAKVRSQVRRPQKEGARVKFGLDQLGPFYDVFARHMRDLGTPVQSRAFFEEIAREFPDSVWFGCAWLKGNAVAGGCGFRWGGEFEMTWASSLSQYNKLAPNMLLYWAFMERCAREGLEQFNFGRCTPGGSTHRFKQQWGSRDVPLWWYYQAKGARAATPSTTDGALSWGPRIWRRLPLAVTNYVGPRVVRYIP